MKQNPCRYCSNSYEYKGRHGQGYEAACYECEYIKEHEKYLESKRLFTKGDKITTIEELLTCEWVFWGDRAKHIKAIENLQLGFVLAKLEAGYFYKAIRKSEEK